MQIDTNPLPPPPPSSAQTPEPATAATYQTLVGDAILSSDDKDALIRFLEGDYGTSPAPIPPTPHLISHPTNLLYIYTVSYTHL